MNRTTTSWICSIVATVSLAAFGCGDDISADLDAAANIDAAIVDAPVPDALVNDGPIPDASSACLVPVLPGVNHHQYVASAILIPTTIQQANAVSLDVDGDGSDENALGEVIAVFSSQADLGIQESIDSQVAGGQLLYIANLEATDLVSKSSAVLTMFMAQDCDFPPVPTDNFTGTELFQIRGNSPLDNLMSGPISGGVADLGPGNMTIIIPLPDVGNISLPMWGARMTGDITATGISNAILGGGVKEEDVQNILVPALHQTIAANVASNCTAPSGPDCNCDPASAQDLVDLFDSNADCVISFDEINTNPLIVALLSSDLDLFDSTNGNIFDPRKDGINDSLSLGIGFTMVGARFQLP